MIAAVASSLILTQQPAGMIAQVDGSRASLSLTASKPVTITDTLPVSARSGGSLPSHYVLQSRPVSNEQPLGSSLLDGRLSSFLLLLALAVSPPERKTIWARKSPPKFGGSLTNVVVLRFAWKHTIGMESSAARDFSPIQLGRFILSTMLSPMQTRIFVMHGDQKFPRSCSCPTREAE